MLLGPLQNNLQPAPSARVYWLNVVPAGPAARVYWLNMQPTSSTFIEGNARVWLVQARQRITQVASRQRSAHPQD